MAVSALLRVSSMNPTTKGKLLLSTCWKGVLMQFQRRWRSPPRERSPFPYSRNPRCLPCRCEPPFHLTWIPDYPIGSSRWGCSCHYYRHLFLLFFLVRYWHTLSVEDIYTPDRVKEAIQVFGADDPAHPSVSYLRNRVKDFYVGGKVQAIKAPTHFDYVALRCKLVSNARRNGID